MFLSQVIQNGESGLSLPIFPGDFQQRSKMQAQTDVMACNKIPGAHTRSAART